MIICSNHYSSHERKLSLQIDHFHVKGKVNCRYQMTDTRVESAFLVTSRFSLEEAAVETSLEVSAILSERWLPSRECVHLPLPV